MSTKTKIVLAATLVLGSASIATAQGFDPNLANRYPVYSEPGAVQPPAFRSSPAPAFEGRNVGRVPTRSIAPSAPGNAYRGTITPPPAIAGGGL